MTGEEFLSSLKDEIDFYRGMDGLVGVIFSLSDLIGLPPSILTHSRRAGFARYKPTIIVFVGAKAYIHSMTMVFAKITNIPIYHFASDDEAMTFVTAKITLHQHEHPLTA